MLVLKLRFHLVYWLLLSAIFCSAQTPLEIEFIGNCGLHLSDGKTNIYVDFPYKSGAYGYMEYDSVRLDSIENNSIFLFTHKHADHYSRKLLKQILKERNGKCFTQWKSKKLIKHFESNPDIGIEVFKTKHSFSLKHNSYLIKWHGKRIYLSGDTENAEKIATIKEIDWAFLPPWILDDAKEKNLQIDSEMIGVYHLAPSEIESAIEEWGDKKNIVPLIKQGEIIILR